MTNYSIKNFLLVSEKEKSPYEIDNKDIEIDIDTFEDDKDKIDLQIQFKTYADYQKFLDNPEITLDLFNCYYHSTYKATINQIISDSKKYKTQFKKLIKKSIPTIIYDDISIIDYKLLNTKKLVVDVAKMSLPFKMQLLNTISIDNNLLFIDKYTNGDAVSYKDLIEMYSIMQNISEEIKKQNFSQIESFYYIYSKLKEREYKKANPNESLAKSRSLVEVLKHDEIVCAGYTNLFLAITDILNLPAEEVSWYPDDPEKSGHSSVITYINDEKYGIKGIFGVDTTWDSKSGNNLKHRNNLAHFLIPFKFDMIEKEKRYNFHRIVSNIYMPLNERYQRYLRLLGYNAPEKIIQSEKELIVKKINELYTLLGFELIDINADFEKEIKKVKHYCEIHIPSSILREVIKIVEPNRSNKEIEAAIQNNPNTYLEEKRKKDVEFLLKRIFGEY